VTADIALRDAGPKALHIASFAWCRPYYLLQPENCFVVDDGHGTAVGYIIGTPDTSAFVQQQKQQSYSLAYLSEEQGLPKPTPEEDTSWSGNIQGALRKIIHEPENTLHEDWPELMRDYPGHLHIDILPEYQRKGLGGKLMNAFLSAMKMKNCKGLHLGMVSTNEAAEKFYRSQGFDRFPKVIDGGQSGEMGRDERTIYMVISL
jgi:ribosomal protein S18 acetylase RimI-like enzyme